MKKPWRLAAACLMAMLLLPGVSQAHSLNNPMYMGLGVYSLCPIVMSLGLLLAPLLLVHVLILRTLVSFDRRFADVLWRAAVIFCVAKLAECLPGLAFVKQAWCDSSVSGAMFFTVSLFATEFAVNLLMTTALFRNDAPRAWRLLLSAFALSASSYAITMLFVTMAFDFTGM
jgi:hypothetical protein